MLLSPVREALVEARHRYEAARAAAAWPRPCHGHDKGPERLSRPCIASKCGVFQGFWSQWSQLRLVRQ